MDHPPETKIKCCFTAAFGAIDRRLGPWVLGSSPRCAQKYIRFWKKTVKPRKCSIFWYIWTVTVILNTFFVKYFLSDIFIRYFRLRFFIHTSVDRWKELIKNKSEKFHFALIVGKNSGIKILILSSMYVWFFIILWKSSMTQKCDFVLFPRFSSFRGS